MDKKTQNIQLAYAGNVSCLAMALLVTVFPATLFAEESVLDEIIVSANKRESTLQDTALSITAFSAEQIEAHKIEDVGDLSLYVPGLVMSDQNGSFGSAALFIRGVGVSVRGVGVDTNVAIYADGVYNPRATSVLQDFIDLERVELVRGPQGTLYGRNATGGALNLISRDPTEEFEFQGDVTVGDYDLRQFRASINGGNELVKGRLSVNNKEMGSFYDRTLVPDRNQADSWNLKGALLFTPSDSLNVTWRGNYFNDDAFGDFPLRVMPHGFFQPFFGATPDSGKPFEFRSDLLEAGTLKAVGTSLHVDWAASDTLTFRSITAWQQTENTRLIDVDGSDIWILHNESATNSDLFTQEFQLLSNNDGKVNWIVGAYYYDESADQFVNNRWNGIAAPIIAPGLPGPVEYVFNIDPADVMVKAWALFGEVTYAFTDTSRLTLGLRYNDEEKDHRIGGTLNGVAGGQETDVSFVPNTTTFEDGAWSQPTYRIVFEHDVNESSMLYASYSTGFKSGGFNSSVANNEFEEESLNAIELGAKLGLLDGRMTLNTSLFHYDYKNAQTTIFVDDPQDPNVGELTVLTPDARNYGAEVELVAMPTDSLFLSAGLSYLDTKITNRFFANDPLGVPTNLKGNELPRAPNWSLNLVGSYDIDLGNGGTLRPQVSYQYQDDMFLSFVNVTDDPFTGEPKGGDFQEAFGLVNASLNWTSAGGQWSVSAFGNNLTDEHYLSTSMVSGGFGNFRVWMPPRTWGLRVGFAMH